MRRLARRLFNIMSVLTLAVGQALTVLYVMLDLSGSMILAGWIALFGCVTILVILRKFLDTPVPTGFCVQCGYDLRASPERCPECGAASA